MAELVQVAADGDVTILSMNGPPMNVLGPQMRTALAEAISAAVGDAGTRSIVLAGLGRSFASGIDVRALGQDRAAPQLGDLCRVIEASPKPVVAALHGAVLGSGLELALAAHWRVASTGVRFGFPEIGLGLTPNAGATQRAPRLIGAAQALRLLVGGLSVPAGEALEMGLIDGMADGDVLASAVALARTCGPRPTLQRLQALQDGVAYVAAVAQARQQIAPGAPGAQMRIIEAVEAALLLPPEAGLALEQAAYRDCLASAQSTALRHVFVAERRLARMPEAAVAPRRLDVVGVVGAGQIGASVAMAVISAGLRCVIVEQDRPALVAALERVATAQQRAVEAGRLTPEAREADWARLGGAVNLAALSEADLVVEAVPEDRPLKASVLGQMGAVLRPGTVIAVTSAGIGLDDLARMTRRAGDVIGFGLPAPLPGARMVEIAVGGATAPDAVATGLALVRRLGRAAIRVQGDRSDGLVAARLAGAAMAAGAALTGGLGVGHGTVAGALAVLGLGWVMPSGGAEGGAEGGKVGPDEIRSRVLFAMVNAAAGMIAEGVVQRPSDIDMMSILTLGLPRMQGGLMHMADQAGILALRRDLLKFAADRPEIWAPHPLVLELFREGRAFGDLNERPAGPGAAIRTG